MFAAGLAASLFCSFGSKSTTSNSSYMPRLLLGPPVGPPGREGDGIAACKTLLHKSTGQHGWDRREPPRGEERRGDRLQDRGGEFVRIY
jgi:hypothetical protein